MLHHFKLQLPHGTQQHRTTCFRFEHLNRTFFTQLVQTLLQLFGAQWVFQNHRHEHFGCKKRQTSELQRRSIGDGVAQLHTTVGGETNDVARIRFVHRFAPLRQEGHHRGGAQLFGGALHFELHAGFVLPRGHAHKRNAVAVVGIHIGLHFEHHT